MGGALDHYTFVFSPQLRNLTFGVLLWQQASECFWNVFVAVTTVSGINPHVDFFDSRPNDTCWTSAYFYAHDFVFGALSCRDFCVRSRHCNILVKSLFWPLLVLLPKAKVFFSDLNRCRALEPQCVLGTQKCERNMP